MTIEIDAATVRAAGAGRALRKAKAGEVREPVSIPTDGMMTVGDLIVLLEDADPRALVVIEGQYGGFAGVRTLSRVALRLNVNHLEGFGPHERSGANERPDATAVVVTVERPAGEFAD